MLASDFSDGSSVANPNLPERPRSPPHGIYDPCDRPSAIASSLRANGSRERAPDDRLGEAIQKVSAETVRIASSLTLLAMRGVAPPTKKHPRESGDVFRFQGDPVSAAVSPSAGGDRWLADRRRANDARNRAGP